MNNTIDPQSKNEIRSTDNDLKPDDKEAPQLNRPLTEDEIKEIIEHGNC